MKIFYITRDHLFQEGDFFVRIYNNNTEIELLNGIGSNIKLVTVPSVEGFNDYINSSK